MVKTSLILILNRTVLNRLVFIDSKQPGQSQAVFFTPEVYVPESAVRPVVSRGFLFGFLFVYRAAARLFDSWFSMKRSESHTPRPEKELIVSTGANRLKRAVLTALGVLFVGLAAIGGYS